MDTNGQGACEETCSEACGVSRSASNLLLFGAAAALELAQNLTLEQMNVMGELLTVIGDQLSLLAAAEEAQRSFCEKGIENEKSSESEESAS